MKFSKLSKSDKYMVFSAFAAAAGIMVLACSAVVSVHAYLSAQTDEKINLFAAKNFTYTDISISEPGGSTYTLSIDGTTHVGTFKSGSANKTAGVVVSDGTDKKPVFIRAMMTYAFYDTNGVNITLKYPTVTPTYDVGSDWTAKTGGAGTYYYYNKIVLPGETAADLLDEDGVTITIAIQIISKTQSTT